MFKYFFLSSFFIGVLAADIGALKDELLRAQSYKELKRYPEAVGLCQKCIERWKGLEEVWFAMHMLGGVL